MPAKVSEEVQEWMRGLRSEIGANMSLRPSDAYNEGWNAASREAMMFIDRYIRGDGLFQFQEKDDAETKP